MSKLAKKLNILHKSGKTVFTTDELALYWEVENKRVLYVQISRAKQAGILSQIQRGLYTINDQDINLLELAGNLKKNSYISFETVLAQEDIINQWYGSYFSATDRKLKIKNNYGTFEYKRLPGAILNNRKGISNMGAYFIATKERALCDYIYKSGLHHFDDISELDVDKIINISKIYKSKRLEKDILKLINKVL